MFCRNCGKQIQSTDAFCNACGTPINEKDAQNAQQNIGVNNFVDKDEVVAKGKNFFIRERANRNIVGLIAAAVVLISMFLPYATASAFGFSQSLNYISADDGKLVIVFLIGAVVTYLIKRDGIACILSAIIFIINCVDWIDISDSTMGFGKASIGCYLIALASIVMIIAPFVGDKIQNSIKK